MYNTYIYPTLPRLRGALRFLFIAVRAPRSSRCERSGGDGGVETASEKFSKNKSTSLFGFVFPTLSVKPTKALTPYLLNFNSLSERQTIYPEAITPPACLSGVDSDDAALS